MPVAWDCARPGQPVAVIAVDALRRREPVDERLKVPGVSRLQGWAGLRGAERVHAEHADHCAGKFGFGERAGQRGEQLVAKRPERRVRIEGGGEERPGEAVQALGRAGRGLAAAAAAQKSPNARSNDSSALASMPITSGLPRVTPRASRSCWRGPPGMSSNHVLRSAIARLRTASANPGQAWSRSPRRSAPSP